MLVGPASQPEDRAMSVRAIVAAGTAHAPMPSMRTSTVKATARTTTANGDGDVASRGTAECSRSGAVAERTGQGGLGCVTPDDLAGVATGERASQDAAMFPGR